MTKVTIAGHEAGLAFGKGQNFLHCLAAEHCLNLEVLGWGDGRK